MELVTGNLGTSATERGHPEVEVRGTGYGVQHSTSTFSAGICVGRNRVSQRRPHTPEPSTPLPLFAISHTSPNGSCPITKNWSIKATRRRTERHIYSQEPCPSGPFGPFLRFSFSDPADPTSTHLHNCLAVQERHGLTRIFFHSRLVWALLAGPNATLNHVPTHTIRCIHVPSSQRLLRSAVISVLVEHIYSSLAKIPKQTELSRFTHW
ncbi:hypothetical protein F5B18DRAFT_159463 [Nemania serpens]|nr:hypothetical protein F5B18DRAFT_159463 [Nemania serpens]